jgi:methylase of polypeptide subunit release factors
MLSNMTASASTPAPWYQMPPRIGTAEEFAAARRLFSDCGYTSRQVCERLQVEWLDRYLQRFEPEAPPKPIEDALGVLIRLFTECLYVAESDLHRTLPAGAIETLSALNLLVREAERPELFYGPSPIYPVGSVLTVCDRRYAPSGEKCRPPVDTVYPAIFDSTLKFADWLPMQPCDTVLDIGTGTGVAALLMSPIARHIWAVDITERAVHFANFNQRLAGIDNIDLLVGDLYGPVEGLTFDRIVSHPPYVPAKRSQFIFREGGGGDGEQIIRSIIEGLPRYLRPDGRFFAMLLGSDREGEPFEARIRKWLGDQQEEFDVMVVSDSLKTPADYIAHAVGQNSTNAEEVQFLREIWVENKTEYLLHGSILIRRHSAGRSSITVRTQAGAGFHGRHMHWLLDFEDEAQRPAGIERLLDSAPFISPRCQLQVRHRVEEGRFVAGDFRFEGITPFMSVAECQAWMARMIWSCDGVKTGREHFEELREKGEVPEEATPEKFATMLAALIANGILETREWPLTV